MSDTRLPVTVAMSDLLTGAFEQLSTEHVFPASIFLHREGKVSGSAATNAWFLRGVADGLRLTNAAEHHKRGSGRQQRAELDPALRFVLRLVRALPWTADLAADQWWWWAGNPSDRELAGRENELLLRTDHVGLRRLLRTAHAGGPTPRSWKIFPWTVAEAVLEAYASGEVDYEHTSKAISRCAYASGHDSLSDRVISSTIERLNLTTPKELNRSRPPFPRWVKRLAGTLVLLLVQENPASRVSIDPHTNTSPILNAALEWLVTLGICSHDELPSSRTMQRWYQEHQRQRGALHGPGRPPKLTTP
jgi:hypothetical protein